MKLYIDDFVNDMYPMPDNRGFIKIGVTHHYDAAKRFDASVNDGYEKNYEDWDIRVLYSIVSDVAAEMERYILDVIFPNPGPTKVWVERHLNCEDNTRYNNCSGITELRLVTRAQRANLLDNMYKLKNGQEVEDLYKPLAEMYNASK